jgi:hypothetical protein
MRSPTRRHLLGLGLAATAAGAGFYGYRQLRRVGSDETTRVDLATKPVEAFDPRRPSERRFGSLLFRSGLELSSRTRGFGGLSGLWRDPERPRIVAVTDVGQWFQADLVVRDGRLAGLAEAQLSPILDAAGRPLHDGPSYDCEALAIAGGVAYVGIERTHEVLRFDWAAAGVRARGQPLALPEDIRRQPRNSGIEALCIAPPGHRLAGALIAFAEAAPTGGEDPSPGWVLSGPERFGFHVATGRELNVTDACFLPTGELLLLERSWSLARGVGCRIRRVPADAIRPGAMLDGEVLMEADTEFDIDNMEGLAVHRDAASGETVLTLLSDDNFNPLQRTLLLEFALVG